MEQITDAIDDEDLGRLEELLQEGVLDHVEEDEEALKYILINFVNSMRYGKPREKMFSVHAFVRVMRHVPESPTIYNIATIMASEGKLTDVVLALMLKGGSPSSINQQFLRQFISPEARGVTPLLREIIELEIEAHSQGKSFKEYTEEQGHPYSLEEVLTRLEGEMNQVGGRKRRKTRKGRARKGKKHTRRR
jgi:hypothetical protein